MCITSNAKSLVCELISNTPVNDETFILQFCWTGTAPKAGQFFMIKPVRSSVFLPRPISIFEFTPSANIVKFLIAKVGKGTEELSQIKAGEKVELMGPLGNAWADFLPENGKVTLVGGSLGLAPLAALSGEKPEYHFDFYAGFKNGFYDKTQEYLTLGSASKARKIVVAAEDGINALNGRIVDFLNEIQYFDAVFACGSIPMIKAVIAKCKEKGVRCYVSMESRMACGAGACLGCTIKTVKGNRRCCADGPIFDAEEIIFND